MIFMFKCLSLNLLNNLTLFIELMAFFLYKQKITVNRSSSWAIWLLEINSYYFIVANLPER